MPYPRIHITNVRGHGIPPCPLCVFPPGDVLQQSTLRRVWHPCHTHAALSGGAAVSAAPTKQYCILPQNSQNSQKPFAEISSHRWHRCSQIFLAEIFSHRLHRTRRILAPSLCNYRRVWHPCHTHAPYQGVQLSQLHQPSSHCIFPQNSQNTQKPLAEMYSHRIHRIFLQRRTSVYSACSVGQYYAT